MDVVFWLASLDLGSVRQLFFDADITGRQFARMDDAQLQELGVTAVGHRKRILTSIQQISAVLTSGNWSQARMSCISGLMKAALPAERYGSRMELKPAL